MEAWRDELYHYGVKGMKWGVRRYQNKDGSYTAEGKKRRRDLSIEDYRASMLARYKKKNQKKYEFYKNASKRELDSDILRKKKIKRNMLIGMSVATALTVGGVILLSGKSKMPDIEKYIDTASMDDIDFVLKEDSIIHRVHSYPGFDPKKVDKPVYASFTDSDIKLYRSMLRNRENTGEQYDVILKNTKDLVSPSYKKRASTFNVLFNEDKKFRSAFIKELAKQYSNNSGLKEDTTKFVKKKLETEDAKRIYEIFVSMLGGNNEVSRRYIDEIKKQGYNLLVDDNNKKSFAETPIAILDPRNTLVKIGEEYITDQMRISDLKDLWNSGKIPKGPILNALMEVKKSADGKNNR